VTSNNTFSKKETVPSIEPKKEEKKEEKKPAITYVPENAEVNPSTGERSRKVRSKESLSFLDIETSISEKSNDKPVEKSNEKRTYFNVKLSRLVSVSANDYKRVAFGGIRDLELTITNDSKYTLDNVVVELEYIKPNELPLKTETVEFSSVAPNGTSTVRVPDTNRGIKVNYRIVQIKSRQAEESVAGN
jgi:hypothetical protein